VARLSARCWPSARHADLPRLPVTARARAGTLEYTSLVWSFVLGCLIWGDVPCRDVLVGVALILAAGTLILGSEQRRSRQPAGDPRAD